MNATPRVCSMPFPVRAWLAVACLFLVALPSPSAGELSRDVSLGPWFDEMEVFYEKNPEYQRSGSGWKPLQRAKWFYEQRLHDGAHPEPGARWRVWEQKMDIERASASPARATWFSVGPTNFAGRALSLAFHPTDPDLVYVGAAGGGLWRTTDAGTSWTPLTDEIPSLAVGAVTLLPSNPDHIIIGTGEPTPGVDTIYGVGILVSTDAGATWQTTSLSYNLGTINGFHIVEANPLTDTILAGAKDGLWRSTDGGFNWTQVRTGGDYYDVKWKPGDANRVYTVKGNDTAGNNVKVSTDDGVTWAKAGTGQPQSFLIGKSKLALTPADPEWVYVIYAELAAPNGLLGVYRSRDEGATWTLRTTTPNIPGQQGWYNLSLAADPDDRTVLYAGGINFWKSTNSGGLFLGADNGVHVDHHDVRFRPGTTNELWVACDGGVWKSTNDAGTWTDLNNGLVTHQFYDICVNNGAAPDYMLGGTQDNGTDRWSGTTTWANSAGADGFVCNIDPTNSTTAYSEIYFGDHSRSYNSGLAGSWTPINNGLTGTGLWVTPVDHDPNLSGHLYTSMSHGIFRTTNHGDLWENMTSTSTKWISMSPADGNTVWALAAPAVVTTDDGGTWTPTSPLGFATGGATKIAAHPTDANTAFITFSTYQAVAHVAMTTDLGATWADVTGDFPSQPVNTMVVDPSSTNDWYIGTDVGVWKSSNGGANWVPFETGFPNAVVVDLEIQDANRKLVAGTHGRGAWEVSITLGANDAPEPNVAAPRNLMLDPPHPNPVSDRTMLRFAAKHEGRVTLAIYDVQGRLVTRLEELSRGDGIIRTTPWFTDGVGSGVYFAVLSTPSEQMSRKIIVTK